MHMKIIQYIKYQKKNITYFYISYNEREHFMNFINMNWPDRASSSKSQGLEKK